MEKNKLSQGFSLLEVIIVVATVGLLAILISSIPNSIRLVTKSRHTSTAREIAAKKIEEMREIQYGNLTVGETDITDSTLNLIPSGSGKIIVALCDPTICTKDENTKEVTVMVTWQEENTRQVTLSTLISEGGLSQ